MIFFKSKSLADWERRIREEERKASGDRLMLELRKNQEELVKLSRQYEKDLLIARKQILQEKNEEIKLLDNKIQEKKRAFQNFKQELYTFTEKTAELSATCKGIGKSILNSVKTIHGISDDMERTCHNFEVKELQYKDEIERE